MEVTGGNALFHVVVDTDETASKLLKELNQEKAGRVTFIPLNQLQVRAPLAEATATARPLTEYMEYEPKFERAFLQVRRPKSLFQGEKKICRKFETLTSRMFVCLTLTFG